jgi:hypothetical protein
LFGGAKIRFWQRTLPEGHEFFDFIDLFING